MIGEDIALTLKIVVAGGFGAGKSTLIGSVSEIRPLHSEETLSESETGSGPDRSDTGGVERKTSTTVAMDFGRITVHAGLSLLLFGTPGQDRFRFLWEELREGALAAVVLADTRRLEDCFAAVDHFWSADGFRSSSPSTASPALPTIRSTMSRRRSTSTEVRRSCCATPATGPREKKS